MGLAEFELSVEIRVKAGIAGQDLLARRAVRAPDFEREKRALSVLVGEMARSPADILDLLSKTILDLLCAGSAGVSLLTCENGKAPTFYWPAIVGQWSPFIGGEMPRNASPCGVVIDTDTVLLFEDPKEVFPAAGMLSPPITEVLLAPFHVDGEAVGTVWALHHDRARKFDREDARILRGLAQFAGTARQAMRDAGQ